MKLKKILAVLLSVSMLGVLSACGEEEKSSSKNEEVATETVAVEEETEAETETETEEAELDAEAEAIEEEAQAEAEAADAALGDIAANYDAENPEETVIAIIESGFGASFGENMNVEYDDSTSTYTIAVWQEGFAAAVETEAGREALASMSSTLESSLATMTDQIRSLDTDANIIFQFVSDVDQSEVLLELENGVTTYSVAE